MNPRSICFTLSLVFTAFPLNILERAHGTFVLKKDVPNKRLFDLADCDKSCFKEIYSTKTPLVQEENFPNNSTNFEFSTPSEEVPKRVYESVDSYRENQEKNRNRIVGFFVDFLWVRALEEGIAYAEIVPQTNTYQPLISYVNQRFGWEPGLRIAMFGCPNQSTDMFGEWTYFRFTPPPVFHSDPNYGILTGLALPAFNVGANELVNSISGKWDLALNSYRIDSKTTFLAAPEFYLLSFAGVLFGKIDQAIHVKYGDYLIVSSTDNSPQRVDGKSKFIGFGPEIGLGFKYQFLENNSIFMDAHFSYLYSWFNTSTVYSQLLSAPSDASITICNSLQTWVPFGQMQVGYSHQWRKESAWLECSVAWEEQFWGGQMRLNWFSNIVSPQTGTTLSIGGVVFRSRWSF